MTFSLEGVLESKRVHRAYLAARPIGEKLRMLDALRERELAIRGGADRPDAAPSRVREQTAPYRSEPE